LAEDVTEEEIIESQKRGQRSGYFIRIASTAKSYYYKKIKTSG
jgi:threonine synthase